MDFQETRRQLRQFIHEHGFEPVMSEFNDIFYDFHSHVQDACKQEIDRCNLFILIVGDRYGTVYHREPLKPYPDSVTLQEFRKAMEIRIPKHIFIEKFVLHDYQNYTHARASIYTEHFQKHEVSESKIQSVKQKLRSDFDQGYPFSAPEHKYVFYFLDLIHDLETNNAIIPFDSFDSIREGLINQWAGLMYEALDRQSRIPASNIASLEQKVDGIVTHLKELLSTKHAGRSPGKISFDISKLTSDIEFDNMEELKEKIEQVITDLLRSGRGLRARGEFHLTPNLEWANKWVGSLPAMLKKYKWSRTINFGELFSGDDISLGYYEECAGVPYRSVSEFHQIYQSLDSEGREALLNTLLQEIRPLVIKPDADEIPF